MNKKLALRTAKLASEAKNLKNSSNISTTYEHQPKDPDERRHGILFGVIDINGSPKNSQDLIELIIDTFHGEYYQDLNKDPLESFENALSKINEELGEYTNGGQTYWMGKLNAILAVYADNTIHITQTGKSEAYLYRSGKESHITEDMSGDSVNPLRTFVNITSGDLVEGDKISVLSSGILASCSPEEVAKYVGKYHPKVAISHIADLIEGLGGSYGQNAAVIAEFLTADALANEALDDEPDEIWLQGTTKKEIMAEKTSTIFQKIFKYLRLGAATLTEFYTNTLAPKAVALFNSLKGKSGDLYNKRAAKKEDSGVLMDTDEEIEGFEREEVPVLEEEEIKEEEIKEEELKKQPAYKSEIRIKESDEAPGRAKFEKTKSSILANLSNLYGSATNLASIKRTKKKLPKLKKNHYLAIGVAIILVFIPYLFITKVGQTDAKTKKEEKAQLQTIDAKIAEASSFASQNEKQKAATDLEDAQKIAEGLSKSKFYSKEAKQKLDEINNQLATITQTVQASPEVVADLVSVSQSEAIGIYSIGNVFYAIGKDGTISKIEKKSKKVSSLQVSGKVEGNIVAATALAKIKVIEILTDKPAIYEFDSSDNSLAEKKASDGWEKAIDIDSYGTTLYLLAQDQIYKHTRTSSGYAKKAAYLTNTEDMKDPLSFKIDSDVYVMGSGGNIMKFTSGKKQDFAMKDLPVNLSSADLIYTDTETKNLLIASKSNKYIVIVGKDGSYKGRYMSNDFTDMRYVLIEGNTVYVTTKTKVLSFEIK
ncbi:MAG: PP2C family serine/threonine-protein phosphatase [Patescibacteria group bacterium]|mgnify:CR=1 FL=1